MTERYIRPCKVLDNGSKVLEIHERIHTRKIDRMVAKNRMKKSGLKRIAHHDRKNNKKSDSIYSSEWRKYTE